MRRRELDLVRMLLVEHVETVSRESDDVAEREAAEEGAAHEGRSLGSRAAAAANVVARQTAADSTASTPNAGDGVVPFVVFVFLNTNPMSRESKMLHCRNLYNTSPDSCY